MTANLPSHWRQDIRHSGLNILAMGLWREALMRWAGNVARAPACTLLFAIQRCNPESGRSVRVRLPEHVNIIADLESGGQAHGRFSAVEGLAGISGTELFGARRSF